MVTVLRNNFFLLTGRSFIFSIIKSDWGFFSGSAIYKPCLSVRVLFHTVYSKMQDFHPAFLIFAFTICPLPGFLYSAALSSVEAGVVSPSASVALSAAACFFK